MTEVTLNLLPPQKPINGLETYEKAFEKDPEFELRDFNRDLEKVAQLQNQFDTALNTDLEERKKTRNYNPVLERAHWERLTTEAERHQFRLHLIRQLETSLRERYNSSQSVVRFKKGTDGNIYSELFPDEPYFDILDRGLAYRQQNNSPELEREVAEVKGSKKLLMDLFDDKTPIESERVVISGPGLAENTPYNHNFIDKYRSQFDELTSEVIVELTRNGSSLEYGQYWNKAVNHNSDYFKGIKGSIDAWFLKHPFSTDIFKDEYGGDGFKQEKQMQKILQAARPKILTHVETVCGNYFSPILIAQTHNDLVKEADAENSGIFFVNPEERELWIASYQAEDVAAGCGLSGMIKIPGLGRFSASNSVAKFALVERDERGPLWFQCDSCRSWNKRPFGSPPIPTCKHCQIEFKKCA